MDYDKMIKNIQYLCKKKEIAIGILEKASGLSVGYLSRVKAKHSKGMSIEKAYRISKELNVSIEDLIERDFAKENRLEDLKREREKIDAEIMAMEQKGE